jgi:NitT/TauT family transport system substrate-binding protein
MTKKIWLLALILSVSFMLLSNWHKLPFADNQSFSASNLKHPIVIGYSNWAGWWPWAIAEEEGLFTSHGLDVELRWYDNYSQSLDDLAKGSIDGNCQTLSDTISFAENAVIEEVAVLVNDNSAGNDKIIAAEGINQVKDLKNKLIAIEAGVVNDFLLNLALEKEGMSRNNVKIVNIETGAAVEAFAVGQADAVGAFAPFWLTALQRHKAKEIVSSVDFPGAIPDLLVVTKELVDERPKEVQALVDTWFDVLDFMAKDPIKADKIMAHRAEISLDRLQLFKAGTKMFTLEDNLEAFSQGNNMKHLSYAATEISDFLQENFKSIEKKTNARKILNSEFVEAHSQKS